MIIVLLFAITISNSQIPELPIAELRALGITDYEIKKTKAMNGSNGEGDNFLIYRSASMSTLHDSDTRKEAPFFSLSHYDAHSGELTEVISGKLGYPNQIEYFEIGEEQIFITLSYNEIMRSDSGQGFLFVKSRVRIVEYSMLDKEIVKDFSGFLPCQYSDHCTWIILEDKKLAFFTTFFPENDNLESSSIYEYDWKKHQIRRIGDADANPLDANTKSSFLGIDINYDREHKEFFYHY